MNIYIILEIAPLCFKLPRYFWTCVYRQCYFVKSGKHTHCIHVISEKLREYRRFTYRFCLIFSGLPKYELVGIGAAVVYTYLFIQVKLDAAEWKVLVAASDIVLCETRVAGGQ